MTPESSRRCLSVCEIPLRCSTGWPALYSQAPGKLNGGRGPLTNPRTSPSAPERRPRCQIASRGAGKCLMNSGFLVWPPRACGRPGADGSELAGKAVQHCIALAKRIGAGVTVLTVLPPFHLHDRRPNDRGHTGSVQSVHAEACQPHRCMAAKDRK